MTSASEPGVTPEQGGNDLLTQILASVESLRDEVRALAENQTAHATELQGVKAELVGINGSLERGAKRMIAQDKSLAFQGRVLRSVSQLGQIAGALTSIVVELEDQDREILERLEKDTDGMVLDVAEAGAESSPKPYPKDAPTKRINEIPIPDPKPGTKPEDS